MVAIDRQRGLGNGMPIPLSAVNSWVLAVALIAPFYIGLTSNGILFPIESHTFETLSFSGSGFPIPISLLAICFYASAIFLKKKKIERSEFALVLYFFVLAFFSNYVRVAQSAIIFIYWYVFVNLSQDAFKYLLKSTIYSAVILYEVHDISYLISVFVLKNSTHSGFSYILKYPVYASYVSYVSGIVLVLIGSSLLRPKVSACAAVVALPLLIFSQRSIGLLFVLMTFVINRWVMALFAFAIVALVGLFLVPDASILVEHTISKLQGGSGGLGAGRYNAWSSFLHEINTGRDLLVGVQRFDLRPHNYWLQLINVGGVPLLALMSYFIGGMLVRAWREMRDDRAPFFFFVGWLIFDSNINSPLTQPYAIGIAMLVLVAMMRRNDYVQG